MSSILICIRLVMVAARTLTTPTLAASEYAPLSDSPRPLKGRVGFPTAKQENAHDCGYACVRILASYHGLGEVEHPPLPETHLSIEDILKFAAKVGFTGHAFRTSYSWLLEKVPTPFIVHWKGEHFIVIHRIDGARVGISDPATGTLVELTKQEFVQGWLGAIRGPGAWKRGVVLFLEKNVSHAQ